MRAITMCFSTMLVAAFGSAACGSSSPVGASTDRDAGTEASTDAGRSDDASGPVNDASEEAGVVGVLDCAWTSGSNCWKATLAPAFGCLPPTGAQGTMSADGTTCTYPDGTTVAFEPPLTGNLGYDTISRFTVSTGNTACLTLASGAMGSSWTTQAGTVALVATQGGRGETVVCPDGTMFSGSVMVLSACASGFPSVDEGYGGTGNPDGSMAHGRLTLSLNDTGADGGTIVFRCAN
jgi:hypothetical protein